jgi:hypothetical protein
VGESAARNEPPVAVAAADRTTVKPGEQVCFDASQSHDPESGFLTYRWSLTHETLSELVTFCRSFDSVGTYAVSLKVTDDQGSSDLDFITITVEAASGACCSGAACTLVLEGGCTGSFQGVGSTCGSPDNPTTCCPANFNGANGLSVQDIFDFLAAYFSDCPASGAPPCYAGADFNKSGTISVQDIFEFLAAYFVGCA